MAAEERRRHEAVPRTGEREVLAGREAFADRRDRVADQREADADLRDARADLRDARADQRDVRADERDARADRRDARADQRDLRADQRDLRADDSASLDRTVSQLHQALETRVLIEQARGMVAAQRGVDVDEALEFLCSHARTSGFPLHDVADAIVRHGLRL